MADSPESALSLEVLRKIHLLESLYTGLRQRV